MKTQAISNQNFTAGKVIFIDNKNSQKMAESLEEILAPKIESELSAIRGIIKDKPYDLFISESIEIKGFYEVNANTSYKNVIGTDTDKKGSPIIVLKNHPERFLPASNEAMRSFEMAKGYKELTRKNKIFKKLLKNIFGRKDT